MLNYFCHIVDAQEEEDAAKILENVHFLALEGKDTGLLWQVRPAYIIVHDPDVSFVRQIEVCALHLQYKTPSDTHNGPNTDDF